jgi:hypothetical protein
MTEAITSVLDKIETEQAAVISVSSKANSLEFLQTVYRNPALALPVRMRAAMACLPFEQPKLAVTAVVTEQDFATLLEQRIKNMERVNNGNARTIEAPPVETKPPLPRLADRRFRRF